jgi:small subunit ribosomal protein S34
MVWRGTAVGDYYIRFGLNNLLCSSSATNMERAVRAIQSLLPSTLPPSLRTTPANLYQVLSRAPGGGVGQRVHQIRWTEKGIRNCYWQVTRTRLKLEGSHGKAWGKLYWKGEFLPPGGRYNLTDLCR